MKRNGEIGLNNTQKKIRTSAGERKKVKIENMAAQKQLVSLSERGTKSTGETIRNRLKVLNLAVGGVWGGG